jgi:iron complex transport system ATP-binding protein
MLTASNVTVRIGQRDLVDHVSISFLPGQLTAVVGPNGAGKSTLLAVLAGDRSPTAGVVAIADEVISEIAPKRLAQLRSVVPQHTAPMFSFSVRQIITMGRHPWPTGAHDDEGFVEAAINDCGLRSLADRSFPTLSGGEQALVNMARVMAQNTDIVLLDEPTAALDVGHQELVLTLAARLARAGRTVIVVVHDVNLACRFANRIVIMSNGRVERDGAPVDVLDGELLSRLYRTPICVVDHPFSLRVPLVLPAPI